MYSKELESLIQATIEDGVLEEHEGVALIKRAEREGVDIDELSIYIDSLLQKRARELENEKRTKRLKAEKEKKEAIGRVCPMCGAQIPPLALKCDCGYEVTSSKTVSSVNILLEKINKIQSNSSLENSERAKAVGDTINMFPVPNTKEDIIEFLSLSAANSQKKGGLWGSKTGRCVISACFIVLILFIIAIDTENETLNNISFFLAILFPIIVITLIVLIVFVDKETLRWNQNAKVWRSKFKQVMMKGRTMRGDAEFQKQLDYYESMIK